MRETAAHNGSRRLPAVLTQRNRVERCYFETSSWGGVPVQPANTRQRWGLAALHSEDSAFP
jgi:hypothetical protein